MRHGWVLAVWTPPSRALTYCGMTEVVLLSLPSTLSLGSCKCGVLGSASNHSVEASTWARSARLCSPRESCPCGTSAQSCGSAAKDPTLRGAREGLVGAYGRLWSVGDVVEQSLHMPSGRLRILGSGCQCCHGSEALWHIAVARTIAAEAVELLILHDGTVVRLAGCYRCHVVQDPLEEIGSVRASRACASPELPPAVLGFSLSVSCRLFIVCTSADVGCEHWK